jgi:hypothetical protein
MESVSKKSGPRYELVVAGFLFLLCSIFLSFGSLSAYFHQLKASQSFVPVAAIVVSAQIGSRGGNQTTHGASFHPEIVYRYSVEGKEYRSKRYFFTGDGWSDRASVQRVVDRYLAGAFVEAYVNPNDPSAAVLDAGRPSAWMFAFLVPFWIFSFVFIYYGMRGRRKISESAVI